MTSTNVTDELWHQEVAYWEYLKAADLDSYRSLWHEDVIGWPNNQPAPMDKDGIYQLVAGILASLQGPGSSEIIRRSVRIYGNIGIAYYEAHITVTTKAGEIITTHERFTHTWLRSDNGWQIIGGMSAPLPGAQTN